jgi:hypothetical protein
MRNLKRMGMVAAALLGVAWLAWLGQSVLRVRPDDGPPEVPLRTVGEALYASEALIDFARAHDPEGIASQEELMGLLRDAGQDKAWLYLCLRFDMDSGRVRRMGYIYRPDKDPFRFLTVRALLTILAGKPFESEHADFSTIEVIPIPDRLLTDDPRQTLKSLDPGGWSTRFDRGKLEFNSYVDESNSCKCGAAGHRAFFARVRPRAPLGFESSFDG